MENMIRKERFYHRHDRIILPKIEDKLGYKQRKPPIGQRYVTLSAPIGFLIFFIILVNLNIGEVTGTLSLFSLFFSFTSSYRCLESQMNQVLTKNCIPATAEMYILCINNLG